MDLQLCAGPDPGSGPGPDLVQDLRTESRVQDQQLNRIWSRTLVHVHAGCQGPWFCMTLHDIACWRLPDGGILILNQVILIQGQDNREGEQVRLQ